MVIIMEKTATKEQVDHVVERIDELGVKAHLSVGEERTIIGLIGDERKYDERQFKSLPGVENVMRILQPYKLVSKEFKKDPTLITIDGKSYGGNVKIMIAGPCSVESEAQIVESAKLIKIAGANMLRGGAFKPRTNPYHFQGLGLEGLKYLRKAKEETGLPIVTEVMEASDVELVAEYADVMQIGTRNMQNYKLLKAAGKTNVPVLLKRGMAATLQEFLMCAEYIMSEGNNQVILCERGIRTFVEYTRNTLDLNIVPVIKKLSHLPIIVDPSHGTGRRDIVQAMALAGIAAGADGLAIEVHPNPEKSVSDADQTLSPEAYTELVKKVNKLVLALD
jgi:3-deoxy-7-phosphoheptulonate synthase